MALAYADVQGSGIKEIPKSPKPRTIVRDQIANQVAIELNEYQAGKRSSISTTGALVGKYVVTRSAIYQSIENRLGGEVYELWKQTPRDDTKTFEELAQEVRNMVRNEIVGFWRGKIDRLSSSQQIGDKLKIGYNKVCKLIACLPYAMVRHRRHLMKLQQHNSQQRYRSIITLIRGELASYRRDPTFRLTRNYDLLRKYRIRYFRFYGYMTKGLSPRQKRERTRILREQHTRRKR